MGRKKRMQPSIEDSLVEIYTIWDDSFALGVIVGRESYLGDTEYQIKIIQTTPDHPFLDVGGFAYVMKSEIAFEEVGNIYRRPF